MKKVLIVGGGFAYEAMMVKAGFAVVSHREAYAKGVDLVLFTGGEDVSPHLYGEPNVASGCSKSRDDFEIEIFNHFKGTPMAGICRGGQFLNVMCGGKMYQDVNNHGIGGTHKAVLVETGEVFDVTSTHHQMMRPAPHGKVLVTACLSTVRKYGAFDDQGKPCIVVKGGDEHEDVEAVQYDNILCFQPHPEYNNSGTTRPLFFKLLKGIL